MIQRYLRALCLALPFFAAAFSVQAQTQLPPFNLVDTAGQQWSSSDHAASPKLIMFWATWCPYCKKLFPVIENLHKTYADQGLEVLAISIRDDGDTAAYARDNGLTMTILNEGDDLARSLGVKGTPTVMAVNANNEIVFAGVNPAPEVMEAAIAEALK